MRALEFIQVDDPAKEVANFLRFACDELKIGSLPKIEFISDPIQNEHSNSFAAFSPSENKIYLYVKGRHILDIFRSLAHELTHYKQSLENDKELDGSTGSYHENEANAVAGQIMRKFNKKHPELF